MIEERLIKYKKNDKYYNGKKLFFITKLYVNPNCYNIYSLFRSEKQRSYRLEKEKAENQTNNKNEIESKKNIYAGGESTTQNFNFYMMSSTSTFNSMVTDTQNFKKREKGKKENKKKLNDELQQLAENKKEIKRNILDKEKIKQMTIKQDKISEERDKETNMLHNKLSKGGTLEINHHVKEKNIEKELVHILVNLKKKLEIEKIKVNQTTNGF